ncbi:MAG: hypothetical protein K9N07_10590 [Candidatus Cloacimonetes bacterium]|nr:hypothetical protein [Candidatus Cloacimonadota bacterium]MCF8262295.1 hypothetical protein [Melioribacteraceae bacterium]
MRIRQIYIVLCVVFITSCGSLKLIYKNSEATKNLAIEINEMLVRDYPGDYWKKHGLEAYAANNGIIINIQTLLEAKEKSKFENICKEINSKIIKSTKSKCSEWNDVEFFFYRISSNIFYFHEGRELTNICNSDGEMKDRGFEDLPEHVYTAWRVVSTASNYKLHWGG